MHHMHHMHPAKTSFDETLDLTAQMSFHLIKATTWRIIPHASPMLYLSTAAMKSTPALPSPRTRGLPLVDPSVPNPSPAWLDIATGAELRTLRLVREESEAQKVARCVLPAMTCAGPVATRLAIGVINKRYGWDTGPGCSDQFLTRRYFLFI